MFDVVRGVKGVEAKVRLWESVSGQEGSQQCAGTMLRDISLMVRRLRSVLGLCKHRWHMARLGSDSLDTCILA